MDPDMTLRELITAALTGDYGRLEETAGDLVDWLARGGFRPNDQEPRAWLPADLVMELDA